MSMSDSSQRRSLDCAEGSTKTVPLGSLGTASTSPLRVSSALGNPLSQHRLIGQPGVLSDLPGFRDLFDSESQGNFFQAQLPNALHQIMGSFAGPSPWGLRIAVEFGGGHE